MKIIAIVAIVLAIGIAAVLAVALTKPDTFRVERSLAVKARADAIYPHVADFHRWTGWSPYETRDPAMKRSFGGAEQGKGATYAWDGNSNVGGGNMLITDAPSPSKVALDLNMTRPMTAHNKVEFTLTPVGDSTTVTWTMNGNAPYWAKIFHVFFNMDKMVGGDFEAGLAKLKTVAEK